MSDYTLRRVPPFPQSLSSRLLLYLQHFDWPIPRQNLGLLSRWSDILSSHKYLSLSIYWCEMIGWSPRRFVGNRSKSAIAARSLGCSKIPCFKQSSNEAEASMLPEKGMKVPALISIFPRPVTTQSLPPALTAGRIRDLLENNTSSYSLLLIRLSLFISSRYRPQTLPIHSTNPSVLALCFRPDLSSLRRKRSCPRPSSLSISS